MQMLNQQYEAQVFNQKHQIEIAEAEALLYAKAIELLDGEGRKVLQPGTISNAFDAINRKQLSRLFSTLRQQASCFCQAGCSGRFWAWIDATGSLMDATGCRWPYLTQEGRERHLSWVNEEISERFIQAA